MQASCAYNCLNFTNRCFLGFVCSINICCFSHFHRSLQVQQSEGFMPPFVRQWPDQVELPHAIVTLPQSGIFEYPHPSVGTASDLICYMLGTAHHLSFNAIIKIECGFPFICYFIHVLLFCFFMAMLFSCGGENSGPSS